jgi:hypothetical protein
LFDRAHAPHTFAYAVALLKKNRDRVETIFAECRQKSPTRSTITEAALIYNELAKTISDIRDVQMVEAILPVLLLRFRERITTPGSGLGKYESSSF